jgi:hypothetical protein
MRRLRQVTSTPFSPGSSSGFSAYDAELYFPALELGNDWIAGAELVVLRSIYDGSVPRVLEMRNVQVTPASSTALQRGGTP